MDKHLKPTSFEWAWQKPKPDQSMVVIIHDNPDIGYLLAVTLWENGIYPILHVAPDEEAINAIIENKPVALIMHKRVFPSVDDIGKFLDRVRRDETILHMRTICASGEFSYQYAQTLKVAKKYGIDIAYDLYDLANGDGVPDWVLAMIKKGYLSPEELNRRGKEVITHPSAYYLRRQLFLQRTLNLNFSSQNLSDETRAYGDDKTSTLNA